MRGKTLFAGFAIVGLAIALCGHFARAASDVIYAVDFAGYSGGPVLQWLQSRGFTPRQDANNSRRIAYSIARDTLMLETKSRAFGLLVNETDVQDTSRLRIEWGVDAFPPGASYEKGVRSEAVMLYVFFGKERHASGSMLVPDSPYFIGLFLCESDPTNKPFKGRYHQATGRFICVDRPSPGNSVTTEFPIAEAFTRIFGKKQVPDISGFAIAIDSSNGHGSGVAKSFIKKIEFLR